MNLHKIWLIARHEFISKFARKSFIFVVFILPLISVGLMVLVFSLIFQQLDDTTVYHNVGVVDQAGVFDPIESLPKPFTLISSEAEANAQLTKHSIDGYFVVPPNFISKGVVSGYNYPELGLSEALQDKFEDAIKASLAKRLNDPSLSKRLEEPVKEISNYRIGNPEKVPEGALMASFFMPFVVGILIFIAITTTSQFLMSGLVEEKENRMLEVFITSARPSEILWGKILGLGSLGLTQMLSWMLISLTFAVLRGGINIRQILANLEITPQYLLLMLIYFLLGYLVYGTIMFSIGALSNAEQESRQIGGFVSLIAMIPYFLISVFITTPDGALSRILSIFPLTAPIGMLLRMAWTNVPTIEIVLSVIFMLVAIIVLIWLAARIFRIGMLNYGKRLSPRALIRAFRETNGANKPQGVLP